MSQDEQKQFNHLQEQLTDATRNAEEIRSYMSSALGEARLYRGLFWLLLVLAAMATIVHILQR
jgi:hypothetical protein